jgi:hypothetical protein
VKPTRSAGEEIPEEQRQLITYARGRFLGKVSQDEADVLFRVVLPKHMKLKGLRQLNKNLIKLKLGH